MPRSPEPARTRMLDSALELFAANGIGATSLREIRLAAGQRNAGAPQYHFGDKQGLLAALLERELPALVARRGELLGEAVDLRSSAAVVVQPFAEFATGADHERSLVRFLSQLHDEPELTRDELVALIGDTRSADAYTRLCEFVPAKARARVTRRFAPALSAFLHAAAVRAARDRAELDTDDATFRADLVDMFLGALLAS
jgi:AcrR family transcriptional regulator